MTSWKWREMATPDRLSNGFKSTHLSVYYITLHVNTLILSELRFLQKKQYSLYAESLHRTVKPIISSNPILGLFCFLWTKYLTLISQHWSVSRTVLSLISQSTETNQYWLPCNTDDIVTDCQVCQTSSLNKVKTKPNKQCRYTTATQTRPFPELFIYCF